MGNSSIFVSWRAPVASSGSVSGYVVEWAEPQRGPRPQPRPAWVKLPASSLSTLLAEHIKDNVCYQIGVSALYRDRAGEVASVRGYSRAKAPSAGPQMYATPWANGILVSWEAIPAQHQRGCITGYRVYLQRKDRQVAPAVYAIPNASAQRSLHILALQPGEHYALWMTASTAAGEGPWGNTELFCLEGAGDWLAVVLTCSFFVISACMCSVPPARKLLHGLLSALVPRWQSKAIPDPANATWAKDYLARKAQLSSPSSLFLHSPAGFEEPEITQVEEALLKPDPPAPRAKLWGGSGDQEQPEYPAPPSPADGERYQQQLPDLYKRITAEQTQSLPEYLTNPVTPRATLYLPPAAGPTGDLPEIARDPLSILPTILTPILSYEGNLTLDKVKINCSSSTG